MLEKTRHHSGRASREIRAHGEQTARRLLAEGLGLAGLTDSDLKILPGSEERKVAIARIIWEQTTVDMKWLAEHLFLRSAANASQQKEEGEPCCKLMLKRDHRWWLRQSNGLCKATRKPTECSKRSNWIGA